MNTLYIFTRMEKDLIFFGDKGLTATSANHLANIAKEFIMNTEQELESLQFYSTSIGLINQEKESVLHIGTPIEELQAIPAKLEQITNAKSLIAWLREAIKAKEQLTNEIKLLGLKDFCEKLGLELPHLPKREVDLTEDDVVATYSIKDRNRYYALEAKASTIGKYIHPSGDFSEARKDFQKKLQHPKEASGSGRDMTIRTYVPTVQTADVDEVFFALQRTHREVQAELNGMKHQVEKIMQKDALEKQERYNTEYQIYAAEQERLTNEMKQYKLQELKKIQALKILIPNDLAEIYDAMNRIGKDK